MLNRLNLPEVKILGKSRPSFQVLGLIGLTVASVAALILARHQRLSVAVFASIVVTAVATFLALVMATKIITGQETIVYYHHEIAVILTTALLLWLIRRPILPYLDITIIGVGLFLAFGRIGCFMVGCCHGRPGGKGVCYGQAHVDAGFPAYLAGVRLFPIQLVESAWVLLIAVTGIGIIWTGWRAGSAFAWYIMSYNVGRFFIEFARGDSDRPYSLGFSQPQWISLLLMLGVSSAEAVHLLPFHGWHVAATAGVLFVMLGVSLARRLRKTPSHLLLHPRHIRELAEAINAVSEEAAAGTTSAPWTVFPASPGGKDIPIACTSLGVRISTGWIGTGPSALRQFSLSHKSGNLSEEAVKLLSKLLVQLERLSPAVRTTRGEHGVFHVLAPAEQRVNG